MSSGSGAHRPGLGETEPGASTGSPDVVDRGRDTSPEPPAGARTRRTRPPRRLGPRLRLPAPPLVDDEAGIRLRPWTTSTGDVDALVAAWADPAIAAASGVPTDRSVEAAARWLAGDATRLAAGRSLDLVVAPLDEDGVDEEAGVAAVAGASVVGGAAVLGEVGLRNIDRVRRRAEISWWTAVAQRRRGLATVATRLLADWALAEAGGDLVQLWARIDPLNLASARVAAAAGFAELGCADGTSVWARTRNSRERRPDAPTSPDRPVPGRTDVWHPAPGRMPGSATVRCYAAALTVKWFL